MRARRATKGMQTYDGPNNTKGRRRPRPRTHRTTPWNPIVPHRLRGRKRRRSNEKDGDARGRPSTVRSRRSKIVRCRIPWGEREGSWSVGWDLRMQQHIRVGSGSTAIDHFLRTRARERPRSRRRVVGRSNAASGSEPLRIDGKRFRGRDPLRSCSTSTLPGRRKVSRGSRRTVEIRAKSHVLSIGPKAKRPHSCVSSLVVHFRFVFCEGSVGGRRFVRSLVSSRSRIEDDESSSFPLRMDRTRASGQPTFFWMDDGDHVALPRIQHDTMQRRS